MGIFSSLKWFKSEKQKELEALQVENAKLEKSLLEETLNEIKSKQAESLRKPYKRIKLVNDVLTIVLHDGNIITKSGAKEEDFQKARKVQFESELFKIATSSEGIEEKRKEDVKIAEVKALVEGIEILKNHPDFTVEQDAVYLKGINRSLPELLIKKFVEILSKGEGVQSEEYVALKRFFMWCCLNPHAEVADQLYDFLVRNSFRITKQGFFVALRNVVTVKDTGDKELVKFISESYNKIKAVWKKKPGGYEVIRKEEGYAFEKTQKTSSAYSGEWIGNLDELYKGLSEMEENRFTDAHTGKFDIRIGKVVNMPPEQCSWNTGDCGASGLHFTANEIHYVGCGDTSVLTLINPMKVVGIGQSKGRCYEYLPIMTVPREEATQILHDVDFDTLELDEDFAIRELENLAAKVEEGFAIEAKKHSIKIPVISSQELKTIVLSLEDMKDSISKRVNVIN